MGCVLQQGSQSFFIAYRSDFYVKVYSTTGEDGSRG